VARARKPTIPGVGVCPARKLKCHGVILRELDADRNSLIERCVNRFGECRTLRLFPLLRRFALPDNAAAAAPINDFNSQTPNAQQQFAAELARLYLLYTPATYLLTHSFLIINSE